MVACWRSAWLYPPGVAGRVVLAGVETVAQRLVLLLDWSTSHWLWLVVAGVMAASIASWIWREWLLDCELGQFWGLFAAVLPSLIPIARSLEEGASKSVQSVTVGGLLLAVAALQLYGQERNNRERVKTEDRFVGLLDEVREGRREAAEGRSAVSALAVEAEKQGDLLREQQALLRRIADGIAPSGKSTLTSSPGGTPRSASRQPPPASEPIGD